MSENKKDNKNIGQFFKFVAFFLFCGTDSNRQLHSYE